MRHYEIVIIIHTDQSDQAGQMIDRYKKQIADAGGNIHRFEDWGRRQLAYPINKIHKAYYVLLNIECDQEVLSELTNAFKYNDAIIRNLVLQKKSAVTKESPILKAGDETKSRGESGDYNRDKGARLNADEAGDSSDAQPIEDSAE